MTNKFLCAALTGAILALAPLSSAVAGEHSWTEARPSGGVATQLVHTSDGLYMVSGARVYLSENDGTTWALHATLPSDIIALATPAATPAGTSKAAATSRRSSALRSTLPRRAEVTDNADSRISR